MRSDRLTGAALALALLATPAPRDGGGLRAQGPASPPPRRLLALIPGPGSTEPTRVDSSLDGCGQELVGCGKSCTLHARRSGGTPPGVKGMDTPSARGPGGSIRGNPQYILQPDTTDVLHNDLEIELFPATQQIAGGNTMTVRSLVDGLDHFDFRLRDRTENGVVNGLRVTSAVLNGSTPAAAAPNGSWYGWRVTLDRPYNHGEVFSLAIGYAGPAVALGFGSIEFTQQVGNPQICSLSEPYFAATWWPCKDGDLGSPGDNADKATLSIAVVAPASFETTANGTLRGVDELPGGRRRYRFATGYPLSTYLVGFSSTTYNSWSRPFSYALPGGGTGTMPVNFKIYPSSDTAENRAAWEKCLPMLGVYGGMFGLYPFVAEQYGIYQFPYAGGMEHQTNAGQGVFSENVTAHELAHQWWGDNVTCRTWSDVWLNEGFATYCEALWEELKPGSSGAPALHAAMANRRPQRFDDSVYAPSTWDTGRVFDADYTYRKGAWVLHMLRHVIGEAKFYQALAAYRSAYAGSAATTDDFAGVVSGVVGLDLRTFFSQWVYAAGAPRYAYGWRDEQAGDRRSLGISVRQTQSEAYPAYRMPMDLRVAFTDGSSAAYILQTATRLDRFVITVDRPVASVTLDESDWILNTGKTLEAYSPGAPVIVRTIPLAGAAVTPAEGRVISVTFSERVVASSEDFDVTDPGGAAVPFLFEYDGSSSRATLDFGHSLGGVGEYTVRVRASITAAGPGREPLDGELADPAGVRHLPSGDGTPGGDAVFTFRVVPECPCDFDHDGKVDSNDVTWFLNAWYGELSSGVGRSADFDGSGVVDLDDIVGFLNAWAESDGAC